LCGTKIAPPHLVTVEDSSMMQSQSELTEPGVRALVQALTDAWSVGDGAGFGKPFSSRSRFVAFDGTILHGPDEIARFHQQAFESHLRNTRLRVHIDEVRALAPAAALVFSRGGIERDGTTEGGLMGDSAQTIVVAIHDGVAQIEAFQNTRQRPIRGPHEAQVWRDFDQAWFTRANAGRALTPRA
jgi:uncharacterized protein (TIGR02246 family)